MYVRMVGGWIKIAGTYSNGRTHVDKNAEDYRGHPGMGNNF